MKILESNIIYENPLPQLCSKQSFFPFLCELEDGTLAAVVVIGQAFESVDSASYITFSHDGGKTWDAPQRMFDLKGEENRLTDYCKVSALPDGRLVAMGYTFISTGADVVGLINYYKDTFSKVCDRDIAEV